MVEWGSCFSSFLRQWHPDWLEKLREDLRFDGWYHAIPCDTPRFSMAEVLSSCSLSPEGRSDGEDLMTSMHVLLEHKGATRNLNGEVKLSSVPKIMAWFPHDFHIFQWCSLKSQQFRIATWAQAAPKQHNLVTAVEAMPSTNEQASVRMVRNFDWEGDQGGGFCKPRLKLNPFDLAKAGQICLAVFPMYLVINKWLRDEVRNDQEMIIGG